MAIKSNDLSAYINVPLSYNAYVFCGTDFEPLLVRRAIPNHPEGGESACVIWSYEQAKHFFINAPFSLYVALCINLKTMKMEYCDNCESAAKFYEC